MMATGTTGARSELLVCADLIRKGYNVFRAVSPHCPCDLLILKRSVIERIEVKTKGRNAQGVAYPSYIHSNDTDIVAVVAREDDTIWYFDVKTKLPLAM